MSRMLSILSNRFRALALARNGAAATEFAFIVPVLAALLLGVVDVGRIGYDRTDLHAAVRSGAQYYMAGGDDAVEAAAIVDQSWTNRPANSEINVVRCCRCGDAEAPCGQLCPDGAVPDIFHEIEAIAYFTGVFGEYQVSVEEVVRAR